MRVKHRLLPPDSALLGQAFPVWLSREQKQLRRLKRDGKQAYHCPRCHGRAWLDVCTVTTPGQDPIQRAWARCLGNCPSVVVAEGPPGEHLETGLRPYVPRPPIVYRCQGCGAEVRKGLRRERKWCDSCSAILRRERTRDCQKNPCANCGALCWGDLCSTCAAAARLLPRVAPEPLAVPQEGHTCRDCGRVIEGRGPRSTRCTPCAKQAQRDQTRHLMREKRAEKGAA